MAYQQTSDYLDKLQAAGAVEKQREITGAISNAARNIEQIEQMVRSLAGRLRTSPPSPVDNMTKSAYGNLSSVASQLETQTNHIIEALEEIGRLI